MSLASYVLRGGLVWTLCPTCSLYVQPGFTLLQLWQGGSDGLSDAFPHPLSPWLWTCGNREPGNLEESIFLWLGAVEAQESSGVEYL